MWAPGREKSKECGLYVQVRHLIKALNEATDAIPGWDDYAKTGKAMKLWDGIL